MITKAARELVKTAIEDEVKQALKKNKEFYRAYMDMVAKNKNFSDADVDDLYRAHVDKNWAGGARRAAGGASFGGGDWKNFYNQKRQFDRFVTLGTLSHMAPIAVMGLGATAFANVMDRRKAEQAKYRASLRRNLNKPGGPGFQYAKAASLAAPAMLTPLMATMASGLALGGYDDAMAEEHGKNLGYHMAKKEQNKLRKRIENEVGNADTKAERISRNALGIIAPVADAGSAVSSSYSYMGGNNRLAAPGLGLGLAAVSGLSRIPEALRARKIRARMLEELRNSGVNDEGMTSARLQAEHEAKRDVKKAVEPLAFAGALHGLRWLQDPARLMRWAGKL